GRRAIAPGKPPQSRMRPTARARPRRLASVCSALAVEIDGLVKNYGRTSAVAGLSLRAERSQVTAILGPNGAGKTTTIEICEGYRRPDQGIVRVLGLDPIRDAKRLRPKVGVMLQSGGIPTAARAGEYLRVMASFHAHPITPALLLDRLRPTRRVPPPLPRVAGRQHARPARAPAARRPPARPAPTQPP